MSWINFTNYKIQSRRILTSILIGQLLIALLFLLVDYFVNTKNPDLNAFTAYFLVAVAVVIEGFRNPQSRFVRIAIPTAATAFCQYFLIQHPLSFQVIIFWFVLIPFVSLLLQGLRASLIWFFVVLTLIGINSIYIYHFLGSLYEVPKNITGVMSQGMMFFLAVISCAFLLHKLLSKANKETIVHNEQLIKLKDRIEHKHQALQLYNSVMIGLSRTPKNYLDQNDLFEHISWHIQDLLSVQRVSIWMFKEEKKQLKCEVCLYLGEHQKDNPIFNEADFPVYFEVIRRDVYTMAPKVEEHESMKELIANYLKPKDIKSKFDCPIVLDHDTVGIISCERVTSVRKWTPQDALIIQSFSDFIALQFKNERIKSLMDALKKKNQELSLSTDQIAHINHELNELNQKLVESNESLEFTVDQRTQKLSKQNYQLKEYAFVNSHMLRSPLSSILGISNLLQSLVKSDDDKELIKALHQSTDQLDQLVRRINLTLEDGSNLLTKEIDQVLKQQSK